MDLCNVYAMKYDGSKTILFFISGEVLKMSLKPVEILERLCLLQGSSLQGRVDSIKYVLHVNQKTPVLVCLFRECMFFPTLGFHVPESVWLQYKYIKSVTALETSGCILHFENGQKMQLEVGARVIYRQMRRCKKFMNMIKSSVDSREIIVDELCYTNNGDIDE